MAGEFNIFILGNDTQSNTDSEGRVAVGGNLTLTNYGVGSKLEVSTTRPDLVVGGSMTVSGGENLSGNTVIRSKDNVVQYTMGNANGVPNQPLEGTPVDFEAAAAYLFCATNNWAALPPTGTAEVQYGELTLTGDSDTLNIFEIDAQDVAGSGTPLSGLNGIDIVAPAGSTILVNVLGETAGFGSYAIFRNGVTATGADGQHILWNLPNVTDLQANTTSIKGSILAPNATYASGYSNVEGTMILGGLTGNVEAHNYPFLGTLPNPGCGGGAGGCAHRQASNDVLESIALQQTALSHILNAEGEKLQKVIAMEDITTAQLLAFNESVRSMVKAVSRLELILLGKAETAKALCPGDGE